MGDDLVPVVMFLSIAAVFIFLFWFRWRARDGVQQTIRAALDKGQELTPELVDRLALPKRRKNPDLRLGVIWLSVAAGLALLAVSVGYFATEALYGVLAVAGLPFAVGIGYLILHWFSGDHDN